MRLQRFRAVITADLRGRAVIEAPFNPDETWGAKAEHPVAARLMAGGSAGRFRRAPADGH
jgi:hypothetical protein